MDKNEAKCLLAKELKGWRRRTYADLVSLVDGEATTGELLGESGAHYQFEIQVFWDDKPAEDIRVFGSIDDGGIRAFFPLTDGFIMSPDGSFVDEDPVEQAVERQGDERCMIMNPSKNRWMWFGISVGLCSCISFHGFYFDYSDRWLHLCVALLFASLTFQFPKVSSSLLLSWLALIILAYTFNDFSTSAKPSTGTARDEVLRELGEPHISGDNLGTIAHKMDGYALPSPLRFRKVEGIDVFLTGDGALWVFYSGNRVNGAFYGGT